jgi:hypothetical protein
MRLHMTLFGLLIMLAGIASATICYQESANTSNQSGTDTCAGLNYTGSYGTPAEGAWDGSYPYGNTIDGDYSTKGRSGSANVIAITFINYTAPSGATSAMWQITPGASSYTTGPYNVSVSDLSSPIMLAVISCDQPACDINFAGGYTWSGGSPFDTTAWYIYNKDSDEFEYKGKNVKTYIYDEAIYWDIAATTSPLNITINSPANTTYISPMVTFNYTASGDNASYICNTTLSGTIIDADRALMNAESAQFTYTINSTDGWLVNVSCANDSYANTSENVYFATNLGYPSNISIKNYTWTDYEDYTNTFYLDWGSYILGIFTLAVSFMLGKTYSQIFLTGGVGLVGVYLLTANPILLAGGILLIVLSFIIKYVTGQ